MAADKSILSRSTDTDSQQHIVGPPLSVTERYFRKYYYCGKSIRLAMIW